jgi:hypothetical protein
MTPRQRRDAGVLHLTNDVGAFPFADIIVHMGDAIIYPK